MPAVRSQNGKKIVVDSVIYFIGLDDYTIYADNVKYQNTNRMAEYSSKEKALKVLDMLEAYACNDLEKLHRLGYPYVSKKGGWHSVACIYEKTSYELFKSKAFQFPKDEDVEL